MDNLFIDYESFWDVGYSLRSAKMNMTDYIHHDQFAVHGASVAINTESPYWLLDHELRAFFDDLAFTNAKVRLVGHHTLFDGYITKHTYNYEAKEYFCTMGMIEALFQGAVGRGLDEAMTTLLRWQQGKTDILTRTKSKYWHEMSDVEQREMIKYANDDLRATQELFHRYSGYLPQDEWSIMSTLLEMFCQPRLQFDRELLNHALSSAQNDRDSRIENALLLFNCTEDDLKANIKFAEMVASTGIEVPMKESPSVAGKMIPAFAKTDQGFQDMLESEDPRVKALAEGRVAVKSTQGITRAKRFLDLDKKVGYLPAAYNYYRAHTGRPSGGNKINVANLKRGSDLRRGIVAPKGYVIAVADSSQIEARDNGYLSGQSDLMDLFRERRDPYNDMASTIFGREINRKLDSDYMEGFIGKTAVLGLGYQMGGPKFKLTVETNAKVQLGIDLDYPLDEAYNVVNIYRAKNYKIKEMWSRCQEWLFAMVAGGEDFEYDYGDGSFLISPTGNKIWFPNGTYLYYPALEWNGDSFTYAVKLGSKYVRRYIYGGKLVENIVQKHSRDIVSWQMLQIAKRYRVVLHTYDENSCLVPESEADEGTQWIVDQMKRTPDWAASLPLDAEGDWAKEYSK